MYKILEKTQFSEKVFKFRIETPSKTKHTHTGQYLKILSTHFLKCCLYNTRTTNTNVNDAICLCHTMECTCHKRIVIRRITEHNKLCTADGILILRKLCCLQYNFTDQLDCIHIDPGLCGTGID